MTTDDGAVAGGLRILFLAEGNAETFDSWSGVSRSVLKHLRALGHEIQAGDADLYGLHRVAVGLRSFGWPRKRWWVRYHLGAAGFAARSARVARLVDRLEAPVDIILQVGATFGVPALGGVPLALYCDSNIELSRAGASTGQSEGAMLTEAEFVAVREREAAIYRRAAIIFTMSERLRRSFIEDFGIPAERLVTVHCGPNTEDDALVASADAPSQGPPTVLFVGRDFRRKGGQVLLDAFRLVRDRLPEARLLMVGGRPEGTVHADGVEFLGFLDRDTVAGRAAIDEAYRRSTLFCLPTRFEPFGTSFVEAMSHELPCVGPAVWAVPEIIVDGETGFLVPPEDPRAFADAMLRILGDGSLAARMGAAGRERAERHFSWRAVAGKISEGLRVAYAASRVGRP